MTRTDVVLELLAWLLVGLIALLVFIFFVSCSAPHDPGPLYDEFGQPIPDGSGRGAIGYGGL